MNEAPPRTEADSAAPNRARRVALAFLAVFGAPLRRTGDQRLVIEHLRAMCGRDVAIFQQDKMGNFDPLRAAHTDGAQTQFLIIKRQVAVALKIGEEKKKVTAKR